MPITKNRLLLVCFCFVRITSVYGQKETYNWYFPNNSALSFSTTPPTILSGSAINSSGGCGASVSDKNGNLLFYTNGMTVWNSQNTIMANGTGLAGSLPVDQVALSVKQPGSNNIYYIFTNYQSLNPAGGFKYSIIDMSLAAGLGSVTSLNNPLLSPGSEKMAATKHCNGTDVWIVTHEPGNNTFLAYLLTTTGINTVPVVSSIGPVYCSQLFGCGGGQLKFNTFGSQLVDAEITSPTGFLTLYDFNKATGVISNSVSLSTAINAGYSEFSSDGSKLYASYNSNLKYIVQWDLCAGSGSAINASLDTIGVSSDPSGAFVWMQLGPDGKIYISRIITSTLSVIHSPNLAGTACNFSEFGQSVGSSIAKGPPGFVSNLLQQAFTYTAEVNCSKASFSAPPTSCMQFPAITGYFWNFGDPASGSANTSTTVNPSHIFSAGGIYTVTSVISYSTCAADTFKVEVTIPSTPQLTVSGKQIVCKNESTIITALGANTFSWSTGVTTSSISLTPTSTTVYSVTGTNTTNLCTSNKTLTVTVNPCTGIYEIEKIDWLIGLYPNPHHNEVTVELLSPAQAQLMDFTGRVIKQEELVVGKNTIELNNTANGIYFLRLKSERNSITLKLVKE